MDPIEAAFHAVPREAFLPIEVRPQTHKDEALPIGYGQTNSQPYTVEHMLRWLEVQAGQKILDVGSGSGWTSALLSVLAGPKGKIYAVEKIPELVDFGRKNCGRLGITNARFFEAGNTLGLPKHAPYDRILVSAAANNVPSNLVKQLKPQGKMVIPVGNTVLEITKSGDDIETISHPGFVFVPLVT